MGQKKSLENMKFGNLYVKREYGRDKHGNVLWECLCDCGNKVNVTSHSLTSSHTMSCGCYREKRRLEKITKHGDAYSRLYKEWCNMKARCSCKKSRRYDQYGGRGISVCEEWQNYITFKQWAIENGYNDSLTLDRINVDEGYCPDNCRWITNKEQQNNKRNNVLITIDNVTHTLAEWCEIFGVNYNTAAVRMFRNRSIDEIFSIEKLAR